MPTAGEIGNNHQAMMNATTGGQGSTTDRNWRPGELEFEAMMRRLDAAGYHTGHFYRVGQVQPNVSSRTYCIPEDSQDGSRVAHARRAASLGRSFRADVEVPPAASSFAANYYKDDATRIKEAASYRAKTLSLQRSHFSNTPNAYKKEEIEEVGTANPKKITHWIEGATKTTGGTLLASEDPNQFAPQGTDPRELKDNLKKVSLAFKRTFYLRTIILKEVHVTLVEWVRHRSWVLFLKGGFVLWCGVFITPLKFGDIFLTFSGFC